MSRSTRPQSASQDSSDAGHTGGGSPRRTRRTNGGRRRRSTSSSKNNRQGGDKKKGNHTQGSGSSRDKNRPHQKRSTTSRRNSSRNAGSRNNSRNGGKRSRPGRPRDQRSGRGSSRNSRRNKSRALASVYMPTSEETSAGGLVVSGLAEAVDDAGIVNMDRIYVCLIGRLDRRGRLLWSIPKGHVEQGEDHTTTAEREVWEETGLTGRVFEDLGTIDYWFVSDGIRIHKTVHHHLLEYVDGIFNDDDPEVTEVMWAPASELVERLAYGDERKLARRAHEILPDLARQAHAEGRMTPW
ncbi:NUDIX domain-containing protein [Corynebacterium pseudokroppenstedtii]|uniref:NUDIX domain-containing protein n=1 Tax=Corynebacterium pseudokroppenstedtii TaxID=2804917 RepID=A0AAU0Q2C5_9CORY|nr:NUDIX hydrolase [Corynebacterium pseudokroppenstedtii]MCF6792919.1 NUDIX domain-containing protein [Corynebacterium pseudokroppenstedtii]MCF8702289.1 NUDIX domain-containing protein [Corynebacterium pseudokroppenstedtii]MCG2635570.1 NUDIX domain-containing protein [Corynebacterium pseudokroppenstedtii]MDK7146596.1 NUDIX domain-containing protein [Corynebacterium pseudokroppenstedtii]